jgi:hypothetical protein
MKIAVSGAHRTGKTTLVEALAGALPGHAPIAEPYVLLAEEGHEFPENPTVEDFEIQLERSIELVTREAGDRIFDRCPADFLAYALTHDDAAQFDLDAWLDPVRSAMAELDLIVLVGVERPDRIAVSADDRRGRRRVDDALRDLILGDRWEWGVPTVEVAGDVAQRVQQVTDAVRRAHR